MSTDKSISQQICELCGIEPLKDENAYFTGNLGKYPDFENNNNNFGKLFDLKLGNSDATIAGFVTENRHYITKKKSFLWVLYDVISQEEDEWMRNLYKDSIKNADWEY